MFLDIDLGIYFFVISFNIMSVSVCVSIGLNFKVINEVIGIIKVYFICVGNGFFFSEDIIFMGDYLRIKGVEFGMIIKCLRCCGWLDLVVLKYVFVLNGCM